MNHVMPVNQRLDELEFLAGRMSDLSEYERIIYEGGAILSNSKSAAELINLTYNLDHYEVILGVYDNEQLGIYCVKHGLINELKNAPADVLKYIDYHKLGILKREEDFGVFTNGNYIVGTGNYPPRCIYDGNNLPDVICNSECYLKLRLTSLAVADGTWLKLPLDGETDPDFNSNDELQVALHKLKVKDLSECGISQCVCTLPNIEESIKTHPADLNELVWKANNVGYGLAEIGNKDLDKYKAALIYEDCTDLDFAADILQNLKCYDIEPYVSSADQYGEHILNRKEYQSPTGTALLNCTDLAKYSSAELAKLGAVVTEYGIITKNQNEFIFCYYTPQPRGIQME